MIDLLNAKNISFWIVASLAATSAVWAADGGTTPRVSVSSRWALSTEENQPAAESLLEFARRPASENNAGLDRLVQRWPDVALQLLRDSVAAESDVPPRLAIAAAYDRIFAPSGPIAGWSIAMTKSTSQPKSYANFRRAQHELQALFQSGRFNDAAKVDATAALPSDAPWALRVEALRLAGLSALLNEKPDRAAEQLHRAIELGTTGGCHTQFELDLLLSEAERRRNRTALAVEAWKSAVMAAVDVRDPELWERAILAKTADMNWPAAASTSRASANEPKFAASTGPDTADVLIGIGKMRLSRGSLNLALLAFSRAESETIIADKKALARLYRVQNMIALGQAASALPMLESLSKSANPQIARRAQAILGDVYCRVVNNRPRGIAMMRTALENADSEDWPGKTRLSANLGLYCILEGRDEEGLRRLHDAEARFEVEEQSADLAEALKNEAAYLRLAGKSKEADAIQDRADEVCRKAGLPTGRLMAKTASGLDAHP